MAKSNHWKWARLYIDILLKFIPSPCKVMPCSSNYIQYCATSILSSCYYWTLVIKSFHYGSCQDPCSKLAQVFQKSSVIQRQLIQPKIRLPHRAPPKIWHRYVLILILGDQDFETKRWMIWSWIPQLPAYNQDLVSTKQLHYAAITAVLPNIPSMDLLLLDTRN